MLNSMNGHQQQILVKIEWNGTNYPEYSIEVQSGEVVKRIPFGTIRICAPSEQ